MDVDLTSIVLADIARERTRQELLKYEGRFKHTCADPEMSHNQCLAVVMEELGEAAHELNEAYDAAPAGWDDRLRDELVQTAACIVAWLERFARTGLIRGKLHE